MSFDDRLHHLASGYVAAPQWVKTVVGGGYSLLPPPIRFGPRYTRFERLFSQDKPDPRDISARLAETLEAALSSVPAFAAQRGLLAHVREAPLEVLRELPLTSKESIKTRLDDHLAAGRPEASRLRMFTGGSTSIPMTFYLHKGVSRAKEWAAFDAMARRFGTDGKGVVLALRGRTVSTAGEGRVWSYEPIKRHLIVSSDHLEPRYMADYVSALQRWSPSYIHAFPSALYPLVSWLREQGRQDLLASVKCVLLTSESVFSHHMQAFRSFFRCPVIAHYGHTERVLFANTLADDGRYHFWPHYGHFELLDPGGAAVTTPGQVGEIVGTSFDNLVMPFVRYRTGDYAALSSGPHASLPGHPVVERIEGRLQEFVVCHDHRLVTVTTLGAAHFEQLEHCLRIQYEQSEPGHLRLRVVPLRPLGEAARAQIERAVRDKTQGGCTVEVVEVESIPRTERGKQRLLLQHLNVERYLGATMNAVSRFAPELPLPAPAAAPVLELPGGRALLMVGTSPDMRGGIAAVVSALQAGGLFERVRARYLASHIEGGPATKLGCFGRALLRMLRMLWRGEVALVHAHVSSKGSFWRKSLLLALARSFGCRTVFHLHSGGFDEFAARGTGGALLRRWIRRTVEASDAVIVLSPRWAEWMRSFAPRSRVEVVGNPVLVPKRAPVAAERASAVGGGRVVFLGLICEPKGCYDLLQAWTGFRARCPGWRLAIGGNGEVERFLERARALGVHDDIDFLGWVSGDAKDRELRRADIFVLPSYKEGMPVSVLEAMAYGLAVVTTPVGGVPDMMQAGVHGLWVEPGDVAALCDRLSTLALDAPLRERLGGAARSHVLSHYSADAVIDDLLRVYARLA